MLVNCGPIPFPPVVFWLTVFKVPEKYFSFKSDPIDYTIKSLGHEIGLKTEYPKTSLMKYEIKMLKSRNKVMKSQFNQ